MLYSQRKKWPNHLVVHFDLFSNCLGFVWIGIVLETFETTKVPVLCRTAPETGAVTWKEMFLGGAVVVDFVVWGDFCFNLRSSKSSSHLQKTSK